MRGCLRDAEPVADGRGARRGRCAGCCRARREADTEIRTGVAHAQRVAQNHAMLFITNVLCGRSHVLSVSGSASPHCLSAPGCMRRRSCVCCTAASHRAGNEPRGRRALHADWRHAWSDSHVGGSGRQQGLLSDRITSMGCEAAERGGRAEVIGYARAGYWSSWHPDARDSPQMKAFLGLAADDKCAAPSLLYAGRVSCVASLCARVDHFALLQACRPCRRCLGFFLLGTPAPGAAEAYRATRAPLERSVDWRLDEA